MSKYFYNKQTLQYEEIKVSVRTKVWRGLGIFCAILFAGVVVHILAATYLPSQKERALMREIDQMSMEYADLLDEVQVMSAELGRIQDRDKQVHRFMFDMEPIDDAVWTAGIGGSEKYSNLRNYPNAGEVMTLAHQRIDLLKRQVELQSLSLDTIEAMAELSAERLEAIPSIKPVRVDLLKKNVSMLSGYGMRLHPIHKVQKIHQGLDFTAPQGTAIQATGSGTVIEVKKPKSGYGRHVIIDHGFDGYQTLYAHMDEIHVTEGEVVKKGQQLGTVGNTGTSTAPHCHYEVRINGRAVNPIHYCLDGLTPEEYQEVTERANNNAMSFD